MGAFRFDCVFYYVSELDRAIAFYTTVLGFELASRDAVPRFRVDGVLFELVPAADPALLTGRGNARLTLGVDDLEAALRDLRAQGVRTSGLRKVSNGQVGSLFDRNAVHRPLAWGEVELRWQFNNNAPPPAIAEPPSEAWGDTPTSYEDLFEELVSRLPPDRRAKLEEELGAIRRESQPKPAKPIVMIPRMVADLDPERLRPAMPPGFANTGTGSHEREYRKIEALVRAGLLSREQQMELLLPEKLQSFLDRIKKEEVPPP